MTYQEQLWESPEPFDWLVDRGLAPETVWEAGLGYVGTPDERSHRRLEGSIEIPYIDARGRRVGARYRHLRLGTQRKYDQVHGTRAHLYGVSLTQEPVVHLTEGEFDALVLRQLGLSAVGVPGATAWKREWRWLFRDTDLVVVWTDADEAGKRARQRIAGSVSQVTDVRTVELPDGMDVTDVYLEDPERLRELA